MANRQAFSKINSAFSNNSLGAKIEFTKTQKLTFQNITHYTVL